MIIALAVVTLILLLIVRAGHTLYSVGSFTNAWQKESVLSLDDQALVIVAMGDSTVQGVGSLKRSDSFISQVAKRVSAQTGKTVQIVNLSVSGADSGQLLESQLPKFKNVKRFDAIVVAVGPNDITHKKSLESFLVNYETLLKQLPADKTVIANLPPMGPEDINGKNSYEWGQALKPVAEKYNVAVALVFEKVNPRANDFRIYGGDFYHPSKAGYKLWADAFEEPLQKILNKS